MERRGPHPKQASLLELAGEGRSRSVRTDLSSHSLIRWACDENKHRQEDHPSFHKYASSGAGVNVVGQAHVTHPSARILSLSPGVPLASVVRLWRVIKSRWMLSFSFLQIIFN